jgi:hypothetical protein
MKPLNLFVISLTATFSASAQTLPSLLDALRASGASIFAGQIEADPTLAALYLSDQVQTVFAPIDSAYGSNFTRLGKRQNLTPAQQQALLLQSTQTEATIQSMRSLPGGSQIVTNDNSTLLKGKGQSVVSDARKQQKKKTTSTATKATATKRHIARSFYPPAWTVSELHPPETWTASELYPPKTWTASESYPRIWTTSELYSPETWTASELYTPKPWTASAPYSPITWTASESHPQAWTTSEFSPPKPWTASKSYLPAWTVSAPHPQAWTTRESYRPTWAPPESSAPTWPPSVSYPPTPTSSPPPPPTPTPSPPPPPTPTPSPTSLVEIFSGLGNSVNVIQGDIPYSGGLIQICDG